MKDKFKLNLQLFAEKSKNKRYYSLYQNLETKSADIYIYGDIKSWEWLDSDVSSHTLSKELQSLDEGIENISVYISSYGGEVKEGLAIYKALKRHKARVTTIADGFVCSIASVIYAAGDERLISDIDLLMIHNAWTYAAGDSNDLRKQADELEKMTQRSINAYLDIVNIEEEELKELMNVDTWIDGAEALEMGFATKLIKADEKEVATQSVRKSLMKKVKEDIQTEGFITKEEMGEIIQESLRTFKEQLELEEPIEGEPQETNKPLNMIKALFNFKEED